MRLDSERIGGLLSTCGVLGDEYGGNECVGSLDRPSHLFGFPELFRILARIICETRIACGAPCIELNTLRPFKIFGRKGDAQAQNVQGMGDFLLGDGIHGEGECAKVDEHCQC